MAASGLNDRSGTRVSSEWNRLNCMRTGESQIRLIDIGDSRIKERLVLRVGVGFDFAANRIMPLTEDSIRRIRVQDLSVGIVRAITGTVPENQMPINQK